MNRGLSLWLDILRVGATLIVVLSHIAYPRFTRGDYQFMRDLNLGSDAVIVFFVISGLVIAYAAGRDQNPQTYAFNRATRLLSVLLPALLLTYILDQWGQRLDPQAYANSFYNPVALPEMLLRGLSFSNEWSGAFDQIRLGTNGPLWSLSYEAAYYVLFGFAFFMRGARRTATLIVLALIFGPRVLLLMPAWVMGACLWYWLSTQGADRLPLTTARLLAWGGPCLYAFCLWIGVPDTLKTFTADAFAPASYRHILFFSDEFIWNALIGVLSVMHIVGMARMMRDFRGNLPGVRFLAGASFSIYVTHYPVLHLVDAAFPSETLTRDGLFVAASLAAGLSFAHIFERRINGLRLCVRRMVATLAMISDHRRHSVPAHQAGPPPSRPAQQP